MVNRFWPLDETLSEPLLQAFEGYPVLRPKTVHFLDAQTPELYLALIYWFGHHLTQEEISSRLNKPEVVVRALIHTGCLSYRRYLANKWARTIV